MGAFSGFGDNRGSFRTKSPKLLKRRDFLLSTAIGKIAGNPVPSTPAESTPYPRGAKHPEPKGCACEQRFSYGMLSPLHLFPHARGAKHPEPKACAFEQRLSHGMLSPLHFFPMPNSPMPNSPMPNSPMPNSPFPIPNSKLKTQNSKLKTIKALAKS